MDVGNTLINAGVYHQEQLVCHFQYSTPLLGTADQFYIFLFQYLQTKNIAIDDITGVAMCSVVPSFESILKQAFAVFNVDIFMLQAGVKTGLNIKYKHPQDVGADKIANAIGAVQVFPNKNLIIVDMSTATSICAINKNKIYLGGTILPGIQISMESLKNKAAKLIEVDIGKASSYLGANIKESIQAGLYYGQLGGIKEIVNGMQSQVFNDEEIIIIGTGSFSNLYTNETLFALHLPHLALDGLKIAYSYSVE